VSVTPQELVLRIALLAMEACNSPGGVRERSEQRVDGANGRLLLEPKAPEFLFSIKMIRLRG
jgi:hypothetical protein